MSEIEQVTPYISSFPEPSFKALLLPDFGSQKYARESQLQPPVLHTPIKTAKLTAEKRDLFNTGKKDRKDPVTSPHPFSRFRSEVLVYIEGQNYEWLSSCGQVQPTHHCFGPSLPPGGMTNCKLLSWRTVSPWLIRALCSLSSQHEIPGKIPVSWSPLF